ncbi:MAG: septum formation initiator family protein [Elusimicrobiota bacterium]
MKGRARRALDFFRRSAVFCRDHWGRILTGAGLLLVFFGNGGFRSLARNWLELRRLDSEIVALEREERLLESKLKTLRAGDGPIERLVRRELGYIKKGEIEYRFPPPEKK